MSAMITKLGAPMPAGVSVFTCVVTESVRVGDACRLNADRTMRKIRQGEGGPRLWDEVHAGDWWAIEDSDVGTTGSFIKVG